MYCSASKCIICNTIWWITVHFKYLSRERNLSVTKVTITFCSYRSKANTKPVFLTVEKLKRLVLDRVADTFKVFITFKGLYSMSVTFLLQFVLYMLKIFRFKNYSCSHWTWLEYKLIFIGIPSSLCQQVSLLLNNF